MKQKNGFTLIEILSVIIVLAVIALIVTPLITGTLKTSKEDLYETQLENIKSAAKAFMVDLDLENDTTVNLTLEELQKTGFLKKEIKNPKTGENFTNCTSVNITKNNQIYNYEVIESEDNECNQIKSIVMILLGLRENKVEKGSLYIDDGIILRDDRGTLISLEDVVVKVVKEKEEIKEEMTGKYSDLSSLIDTSDYYKYEITYSYTYNEEVISKVRDVNVVEKSNLECMILPTEQVNEYGWVVSGERKAKILSINSNENVQYSLSLEEGKKEYSNNQIITIPNDGKIKLYGHIKDAFGNEASCENEIKYEIEEPKCDINASGFEGENDWFISDVTATMNITPISKITKQNISLDSVKSYDNISSLNLTQSQNVYGYIKDEAGKEVSCEKLIKIDKKKPTVNLSGSSYSTTNNKTSTLLLTASALDKDSGIKQYAFYKISGTNEELLSIIESEQKSQTFKVNSPKKGDDYKVIVFDKAGHTNEYKLEESCDPPSYGYCSNGSRWVTVSCATGYTYKYTLTSGCPQPTTTTTSGSSSSTGSSSGSTGGSSTSNCYTVEYTCQQQDGNCISACSTTEHTLEALQAESKCKSGCPFVSMKCYKQECD